MKLFTVRLTDEERAKLEAHRVRLGCRSHSDVVRYWIADETWRDANPVPGLRFALMNAKNSKQPDPAAWNRAVDEAAKHHGVDLSIGPVKPKPGSRLKGTKK